MLPSISIRMQTACVSDAATELPSHCPQGLEQIQNGQAHQTVTLVASLVATFQQSKQPMMCCTRVTQHEHSTPLKSHHTQKYTKVQTELTLLNQQDLV